MADIVASWRPLTRAKCRLESGSRISCRHGPGRGAARKRFGELAWRAPAGPRDYRGLILCVGIVILGSETGKASAGGREL